MKNWFVSSFLCLLATWPSGATADNYQNAQICLRKIDLPCARNLLDDQLKQFPDSEKTLELLASVLFHEGKYEALEQTLEALEFPEEDNERGPPYRATIEGAKGLKEYRRDGISIRHGAGSLPAHADSSRGCSWRRQPDNADSVHGLFGQSALLTGRCG